MVFSSSLSPKTYLSAMGNHMGEFLDFGSQRFTGFSLGPVFYVTFHSGFEWNRRITNQKNAALGYVKAVETGCEVRFLRFRGFLCPLQFLLYLVLSELIVLCSGIAPEIGFWPAMAVGFDINLFLAPLETLMESMTDESEEGRRTLLSFLQDPSDPYGNYAKTS